MAEVGGHQENRCKICVVCSRFASRKRPLSNADITSIKEYVDGEFNLNDPDYPCALCNGCYLLLNKKRNGHDVVINVDQKYKSSGSTSKFLRSTGSNCNCSICKVVQSLANDVNARVKTKKKRGRPKETTTEIPQTKKICSRCLSDVYPGCRHNCRSDRYRQDKVANADALLSSPTSSQLLAAKTIRKSIGYHGKTSDDFVVPSLKKAIDQIAPKRLFSADDMCLIRKDLNLSSRRTLQLCQTLREISDDRKIIEKSGKKKLFEKSHEIDKFFEHTKISFYHEVTVVGGTKYSENFEQHVIIVNDISGLIDKVIFERNLNEDSIIIRIGLDGGGGFMKICLSLFDLDAEVPFSSKKPGKNFKNSGVKKVFIVSIAPGVPEYYVNVKKMWIASGLNRLRREFTIATDLKLCNVLLGLQNHSSMHPCCWCDVDMNSLHTVGKQRTFKSLSDLFWSYFGAGSDKKNAKKYGNVVHLSIIEDVDESTPVITKVPPPELHLMLGPVNHMYNAMEKVWSNSEAWLKSCFVKKSEYHGGALEGNECRKLLKNVAKLEELCPEEHLKFPVAYKSFNEVVSSCYGSELKSDYKDKIETFKNDYMRLKISVTPKVHAVFFHVQEFCELTGKGLGPWSEQTSESLHQEFNKCWQNYIVKDQDNPMYKKRLLEAVQMFNNLNL